MMTTLWKFESRRGRALPIAAVLGSIVLVAIAAPLQAQAPPQPPSTMPPLPTRTAPSTSSAAPQTITMPPAGTAPATTAAPATIGAPSTIAEPVRQAAPTVPSRPMSSKFVEDIDEETEKIELTVNTSKRLTLAEPFPNVVVNNPDVVSATPVSNTQILLHARRTGYTELIFETESGKTHTVQVLVLADATEVNMIIQELYPRANINVVAYNSTATVTGYVDDPTLVTPIMQTVQEFFPTAINGIQVGGGQQVLVKIKIMEVSRTKLRQLGVDFADITNDGDFVSSSISGLLRAANVTTLPVPTSGAQTFQFGIVDANNSFFLFLDALRQQDIAKILADPEVTAISGRPAYFLSGGEIPIIVPQSLGTVSIQYQPYGTQVDFVPIIRNNGTIRLEVRPQVSEIDVARSVTLNGMQVPALTSRIVDTGVEMRAGQTLAIAGLVQTRVEGLNRGLPYISDIPYLGVPFRRIREQVHEVELLILVTPYLVEAGELPCFGPGMGTTSPTDNQLYLDGNLEVPGPIHPDMAPPGGMGGPAPIQPVESIPQPSYPLPPPESEPKKAAVSESGAAKTPGQKQSPSPMNSTSKSPAPGGSGSTLANSRYDRNIPNPTTGGGGNTAPSLPGYYGPVGYDDLK